MSRRLTILALAVGLIAGACSSGPSQDEFDAEVARVQAAENRIAQLESQLAGTEDR